METIARVPFGDLNRSDNVRCRFAHQVNLDPIVLLHLLRIGVLRFNPLNEPTSRKAAAIDSERSFDGLQRQAANLNHLSEERCQRGILKIARDKTELILLGNIAECDIDSAFPVEFTKGLDLSQPRLDYHLQRLVDGRYVDILFEDSALGQNFSVTQKGRAVLVKKHLI